MKVNTQLIKQIIISIDEQFDGQNALFQDSLKTNKTDLKTTFFHTEMLFKVGYITFFKHFLTKDNRNTFIVGGLTQKGDILVKKMKDNNAWENEVLEEIPNVLIQNFNYYMPPHIDGDLWRYMDISKLESLLSSSSLYFCRSDLLGDPFEGSASKPTIKNRPKFYEGATRYSIEKCIPYTQKKLGQCTYISCWHFNPIESALMWRSYSLDDKCISIRTTIRNLVNSISCTDKEFILSPIYYIDYSKDYISEANAFQPYIHKQKQYESEREFRIITSNLEMINDILKKKVISPKGLLIKVDIKQLIHSVVISPYSDENFKQEVEKLIKKYKLSGKIQKSSILLEPEF